MPHDATLRAQGRPINPESPKPKCCLDLSVPLNGTLVIHVSSSKLPSTLAGREGRARRWRKAAAPVSDECAYAGVGCSNQVGMPVSIQINEPDRMCRLRDLEWRSGSFDEVPATVTYEHTSRVDC